MGAASKVHVAVGAFELATAHSQRRKGKAHNAYYCVCLG